MPAHFTPKISIFKIYNKIYLNSIVTHVAGDLMLLLKWKLSCQLSLIFSAIYFFRMLLHKSWGLIIGIKKPRASTFKIWSLNYSTHCRKCAVCRLIRKPLGFKDIAGSFEFCTLNSKGLTHYGWFVQSAFKSNFRHFFWNPHIWNVG